MRAAAFNTTQLLKRFLPGTGALALAFLAAASARSATVGHSEAVSVSEISARLTRCEQNKRANLEHYSVVRKYVLRNSHMDRPAEMTVRISYSKLTGKTFQVLSTSNAAGMSRKVLDRILASEVDASRPQSRDENSLTPANYSFELAGMTTVSGRRCYVLDLHPKRRTRYLLQGKIWVDAQDFAVMKLEARPASNVSFWVGKPYITQEFKKYGDFWMASMNHSMSESHLLGKSELTIEYTNYDLHPVDAQRLALQTVARPLTD